MYTYSPSVFMNQLIIIVKYLGFSFHLSCSVFEESVDFSPSYYGVKIHQLKVLKSMMDKFSFQETKHIIPVTFLASPYPVSENLRLEPDPLKLQCNISQ